MRLCGSLPTKSVWFLNGAAGGNATFSQVAIADLSACRVVASLLLVNSGNGQNSLSTVPCFGAFYATVGASGFGQILPTGAVVQSVAAGLTTRSALYDPVNKAVALLTSTTTSEVSLIDGHTIWTVNHGIGSAFPAGIDCDRLGRIAIAMNGQVRVYNGANGVPLGSQAQAGAGYCRYDASGNLYVGGSGSLTAYAPNLALTIWTKAIPVQYLSCGDGGLWIESDAAPVVNSLKLKYTDGSTLATIPNTMIPCAIPGDQAVGLALILGTSGPTISVINSSGKIGTQGDRIGAYQQIAFSGGHYTTSFPTQAEPSSGRIGAFKW